MSIKMIISPQYLGAYFILQMTLYDLECEHGGKQYDYRLELFCIFVYPACMSNIELLAAVKKMRDIFEKYHGQMEGLCLHDFPRGSCEPTSTISYLALKDLGFADTCMFKGDLDSGNSHYWLKTNGINIDMTYDQDMVAGNKLYGFTIKDVPYSKWSISKVSHEDVLEKIRRFKLQSDIEKFLIEIKES